MEVNLQNLEHLFRLLDDSGDAEVTEEEFIYMLQDDYCKTWIAALDLDASDGVRLFRRLADDSGIIHLSDWANAVKRLKGTSKGIDMVDLLRISELSFRLLNE